MVEPFESKALLVETLVSQGQPELALAELSSMLAASPQDCRLLGAKARALNNLGRLDEAEAVFRQIIAIDPENIEGLAGLGHVAAAKGDIAAAEHWWQRALQHEPDHVRSLKGLARLMAGSRRPEEACRCLTRVSELEPEDTDNWLNLAELLQFLDRFREAVSACKKAAALEPGRAEVHETLGRLHYSLGDVEDAEQAYAAALRNDPDSQEAASGRALCLDVMGRRDAGLQLLDPYLVAENHLPCVDYAAGRLLSGAGRYEEALACLKKTVSSTDRNWRLNPRPWYALGSVLEKLGEYGEAFDAWSEANRLKPALFREEEFEERVRAIIHWYTKERIASWSGVGADSGVIRPLFIVGMPRSGTTLVEQILDCHPRVHAGGERLVLENMAARLWNQNRRVGTEDPVEAGALRKKWEHSIEELSGQAFYYTDKFPGNFMHLGLARIFLPEMSVIWCRRNAADTALSIFANDFNRHIVPWANSLEHIALVWKAHEKLMQHWLASLGIPVVQVRYESLVENPEDQVRGLLQGLSLAWEPACLRFHENRRFPNTASFDQVRRPLYTSTVGRHRRYGRKLEPFLSALSL